MASVYIETSIVSYLRQRPYCGGLSSDLLTWNCKHIANAKNMPRIHEALTDLGYPIPIICTPEEMVDDDSEAN